MDKLIIDFYSKPNQIGGSLPYFAGERYGQIGGGFLGNIGRFLLPIVKTVGRELLGIGVNAANDVINKNKKPFDALKQRGLKRAKTVINKTQIDSSDDTN